jgi:hypothetical protein
MAMSVSAKKSSISLLFFSGLIAFCLALDVADIWQRNANPESLASLVCSIRPYLTLANVFFSKPVVEFAAQQCLQGNAQEPLFSIVFFMLKLNITVLLALGMFAYMAGSSQYENFRSDAQLKLLAEGGVYRRVKTGILIMAPLFIVLLILLSMFSLLDDPLKYPIGKFFFKGHENFAVLIVFLILSIFLSDIFTISKFYLKKSK